MALANITLPHVFRLYGFGPGDDIHDRALAGYNEAKYGLSKGNLTTDRFGLVYIPLREMWSEPDFASLSLNAGGVWVVDQLSDVSEVGAGHSPYLLVYFPGIHILRNEFVASIGNCR